jgi:hypothetical protein
LGEHFLSEDFCKNNAMKHRKRSLPNFILPAITFLLISVVLCTFLPFSNAYWQEVLEIKGRVQPAENYITLQACTYSSEFWKEHPDAWQVDVITLGTDEYSKDQVLDILSSDQPEDASILLAQQLIAAKLNVLHGVEHSHVDEYLAAADDWFISLPIGSNPKNEYKEAIISLASMLNQYNLGFLGPSHCEDEILSDITLHIMQVIVNPTMTQSPSPTTTSTLAKTSPVEETLTPTGISLMASPTSEMTRTEIKGEPSSTLTSTTVVEASQQPESTITPTPTLSPTPTPSSTLTPTCTPTLNP